MAIEIGLIAREHVPLYGGLCPNYLRRELEVRPEMFALGALHHGQAAAILVARGKGRELYIDYIYTASSFRRLGLAGRLIDALCEFGADSGLFDTVRCPLIAEGAWTMSALLRRFLLGLGFAVGSITARDYAISLGELAKIPFWHKPAERPASLKPFSELPEFEEKMFLKHLRQELADPHYLPYMREEALPALSFAAFGGSEVKGVAVVEEVGKDLQLSFLYNKDDGQAAARFSQLLKAVYAAAAAAYPPKTIMRMTVINEKLAEVVEKLCPGAVCVQAEEGTLMVAEYMRAKRVRQYLAEEGL